MKNNTFPISHVIEYVINKCCWTQRYGNASSEIHRILAEHLPESVGFLDILENIDKIAATRVYLENFSGCRVRSGVVSEHEAEWVLVTTGLSLYGFSFMPKIESAMERMIASHCQHVFVFERAIAGWDFYNKDRVCGIYLDEYYKAMVKIIYDSDISGISADEILSKMADMFPERISGGDTDEDS